VTINISDSPKLSPEEEADAAKRLERAKRIIRGALERTADRGCTEAEALANAERVSAMLAQFNLSLTDVIVRDVSDMVEREVYAADKFIGSVVTGIGRLCSLQTYHKTASTTVTAHVMYGHAPDVEFGLYLYEVIAEAAETDWVADMARNGYSKAKRESFRQGFAQRVRKRLTDLKDEQDAERDRHRVMSAGTDLVVLKDQIVAAEFEKTGVKLVMRAAPTPRDRAAYYRGVEAGTNVNLSRPLQGPGKAAGDGGRLAE
jgi:hypothetical protein